MKMCMCILNKNPTTSSLLCRGRQDLDSVIALCSYFLLFFSVNSIHHKKLYLSFVCSFYVLLCITNSLISH